MPDFARLLEVGVKYGWVLLLFGLAGLVLPYDAWTSQHKHTIHDTLLASVLLGGAVATYQIAIAFKRQLHRWNHARKSFAEKRAVLSKLCKDDKVVLDCMVVLGRMQELPSKMPSVVSLKKKKIIEYGGVEGQSGEAMWTVSGEYVDVLKSAFPLSPPAWDEKSAANFLEGMLKLYLPRYERRI
ncbi:MAG: hypothetical protein K2P94_17200 [Rhodospirillaceae bacterium]|nr:hypothetical protein [Rhodospirillaceae bacterium]